MQLRGSLLSKGSLLDSHLIPISDRTFANHFSLISNSLGLELWKI